MSELDLGRFRGLLGADFYEKRRQMIEDLLAACEAPLADQNATDPTSDRAVMEQRIRTLKECLSDLQRLTELGQVVSTLVHEASQPLSAISNYTAACHRLAVSGETEQLTWALKQIADQTERAWQIIQRIREFAK